MIATAFTDLCSNALWEELIWLEEQPRTKANCDLYDRLWNEISTREQRRQYLADHFG